MDELDGQVTWSDLGIWSGKTSPEHSVPTAVKTSGSSLKRSAKSQSRLPLFLDLRKGSGAVREPSWEMGGALLGEYTMHSFGESPREENASRLSQILVDSAHPKYCLSERAVIGILRRATRRGKELPIELKLALQNQSGVVGDSFGQTEIANAGKILRTLWEEVGEKTFVEWIRRAFVLVSEKTLLLCGLREQESWRKETEITCSYAKGKQTSCEECLAGCPVRYLWENGIYGSASHRQESDEQRSAELSSLMQELSRQTAPLKTLMCCLRRACEGSQPMQQALASVEKEQYARMGYGVYGNDPQDSGGSERINPFGQSNLSR